VSTMMSSGRGIICCRRPSQDSEKAGEETALRALIQEPIRVMGFIREIAPSAISYWFRCFL